EEVAQREVRVRVPPQRGIGLPDAALLPCEHADELTVRLRRVLGTKLDVRAQSIENLVRASERSENVRALDLSDIGLRGHDGVHEKPVLCWQKDRRTGRRVVHAAERRIEQRLVP